MHGVVIWIVARHNPAHDLLVLPREKQSGIAVLVEWMTFAVEKGLALDDQRRHPRRIVVVDTPGKPDEGTAVRTRRHLRNLNLGHERQIP